jgi:hypothetical protein
VQAYNVKGWSVESEIGNGGQILWGPSAPLDLTLNEVLTTRFNAAFTWSDVEDSRGAPVIDYQVWYDQAVEEWVLLRENIVEKEFIETNLVTSWTYNFKVRARNAHDFGDFSEPIGILIAQEPVTPSAPVLTLIGDNVQVTWEEPPNAGQPILGYRIYFQKADLTFNIDFTYCDGEDLQTLVGRRCSVPSNSFVSALYGLNWGDKLYAKITAHNSYGDSGDSALSAGLVLMTNPDAPVSLIENTNLRTYNTLALVWQDGASPNGDPVFEYVLSIAIGIDSTEYSVFQDGIVTKSITIAGLTVGEFYKFKVQSKNNFGLSEYSNELVLLCAWVPSAPAEPQCTLESDFIRIAWEEPSNGGSNIYGYRVEIRTIATTWVQDLNDCDGSLEAITDQLYCDVKFETLMTAPFNLPLYEQINVRMVAYNIYGESELSLTAQNLWIVWKPESVLNLRDDTAVSSAVQIGLLWDEPVENNGREVIDYLIEYD